MIMRTWKGTVRASHADRYLEHQAGTGVSDYRATPGNLGVIVIHRDQADRCEVTTVSLWDSMESVRRFAGERPERAKFYPGDDELLVEKDLHADHYEVVSASLNAAAIDAALSGRATPPGQP